MFLRVLGVFLDVIYRYPLSSIFIEKLYEGFQFRINSHFTCHGEMPKNQL